MKTEQKWKIGDCLQLLPEISDKSVDLVIADPQYGIGIGNMNFTQSGAIKVGGAHRNDYTFLNLDWDKNTINYNHISEMLRISQNQMIFGANHFANLLPNSRGWIIWDKRCKDKYSNDFADCELINGFIMKLASLYIRVKPFGKSIMAVLAEVAQMDLDEIRDNTKRGRDDVLIVILKKTLISKR